jgi:hypothetical protein
MSRLAEAPSETYRHVTAKVLAEAVITLLDDLGIKGASFWGCSFALALVVDHLHRVRSDMPHEAPTKLMPQLSVLAEKDEDSIV